MGFERAPLREWAPKALVTQLALGGRATMAKLIGDGPLLLVLLDERNGELESTLATMSPFDASFDAAPAGSNLAFKTELREPLAGLADRRGKGATATDSQGLSEDLLFQPCFAVPVMKRVGSTSLFAERVTVGRARNHDIVLRHRSVSKFHAWFELDDTGGMRIGDAGSSNHTYVDGRQVTEAPLQVQSGVRLKFGSVEAVLTTQDALWTLVERAPF